MKINEILVEAGFLRALGRGIAKGVGFTPEITSKFDRPRSDNKNQAPKSDVQNKAVADLTRLAAQQQNSVNLEQIAAILARYTTETDKDKLMGQVKYIGNLLLTKGIDVPEIKSAQDAMTRAETGTRLVSSTDTFEYDPRTRTLTIIGANDGGEMNYRKMKTQTGTPNKWLDIHSDEEVTGAGNRELDTAFDIATGRAPVSNTSSPATVGDIPVPPNQELRVELTAHPGIFYYKFPDGSWRIKYANAPTPIILSSAIGAALNAMDPSTLKSQTFAANPNP